MSYRFLVVGILAVSGFLAFASDCARGQELPPLLAHMVGNWTVTERMWQGPNASPITLPDATATRRAVGDSLIEETMIAVRGSKSSFTRIADINFNVVTHQFEYFSWDSRAPQMMSEMSRGAALAGGSDQHAIALIGGTFLAPQWGKLTNVSFKYRLALGQIQHGRQTVQLYFTPQPGPSASEFLAFEYVYERRL